MTSRNEGMAHIAEELAMLMVAVSLVDAMTIQSPTIGMASLLTFIVLGGLSLWLRRTRD